MLLLGCMVIQVVDWTRNVSPGYYSGSLITGAVLEVNSVSLAFKMALKKSYKVTVKPRKIFLVKNQARWNSQREVRLLQLHNPRSNHYRCGACIPSRHTHTPPPTLINTDTQSTREHRQHQWSHPAPFWDRSISSSCWHQRHTGLWPPVPLLGLAHPFTPVSTVAGTQAQGPYDSPGSPFLWDHYLGSCLP